MSLRNRYLSTLSLGLCLAMSAGAMSTRFTHRAPAALQTAVSEKLERAINAILPPRRYPGLEVGIIVSSPGTNQILYERNADALMIPASVNKIFTSYAALKKLGPDATFKTTLYVTGPENDGTLAGDLYIKGGGDPSLVSERMWMLVNELFRSGIRNITGNLITDSTYYDLVRTPTSRPKYLKDQAYNSPIGALSFNFNTCTVYIRPAGRIGAQPIVFTDPANNYIDVVNQATTGRQGSADTLNVTRTAYVKGDLGDTVLLRGSIPLGHEEVRFYKNIVNPALYAGNMMKIFMARRGIKLQGNVLEGKVPADARIKVQFESEPLWQVIWGMAKFSNNFVADMLMKKLGAEAWGPPGTMVKGTTALADVLEDIGIRRNTYHIIDGSGLTRETRVTPREILRVLNAAYDDFSLAPEFLASLSIAGEDGTLRHRLANVAVQDRLRAKTGTLDGVTGLAGYTESADNELLSFAILLNDPKVRYGRMSGWADRVALAISKFSRR